MKDDNLLCKLYVDTYSDVSHDCETEILDRDSDVPTTPPHKQLQSIPVKVKQVQSEEGSSEPHSSDDKTSQETKDTGRVLKIQPVYILCRNSGQFTALSKNCHVTATIPWQGNLKFRMYNPR
jgi:hypothetical protein